MLIASDPALRRIVVVYGYAVVFEFAPGCESPFLVGRKPVGLTGLARQPAGVGISVVPTDLHGRAVDCDDHAAIKGVASTIIDAALVVVRTDLILHDREWIAKADFRTLRV